MSKPDAFPLDEMMGSIATLRASGQSAEALSYAEGIWIANGSELDPEVPESYELAQSIAELRAENGDPVTAEGLYRTLLEYTPRDELPEIIARSTTGLAFLLDDTGNKAEAQELYEKSIPLYAAAFGTKRVELATQYNNLAVIYKNNGFLDEAEPLYIQALAIYKDVYDKYHPDLATAMNNLGVYYCQRGDLQSAESMHLKALIIRQNVCRHDDPDLAQSYSNLAVVYHSRGWLDKAEGFYQKALGVLNAAAHRPADDLATTIKNYASLLRMVGKDAVADNIETRI